MAALWGQCASESNTGQPRVEAGNVARNASKKSTIGRVVFFGADELRSGRHVARFTILEGAIIYIGVVDALVAAEYRDYGRDVAWAVCVYDGTLSTSTNPLMGGRDGKQLSTGLFDAKGATVELKVDMDARGMLVSVKGGAAVDAEVKLPEAVRLYCRLFVSGDAVRLESVRSIGGAAAPSPSGAEKRLTAAEVDSMKVSELRKHLEARGLNSSGLKLDMAARLKASLLAVQQAGSPSSGAAAGGVNYPCGLVNLGNTCFLNSVLQCLAGTPTLINLIRSEHSHQALIDRHNLESDWFVKFEKSLMKMINSPGKSLRPVPFTNTIAEVINAHRQGEQEDAQEYFVNLLERLNHFAMEAYKKIYGSSSLWTNPEGHTSYINQIFAGSIRSQVVCRSCIGASNAYDPFTSLSLELKDFSCVTDCLGHFTKIEKLGKDNAYKCDKCKRKSEASKQLTIDTLPNVLVLQLKRFSSLGMHGGKISRHIAFDQALDMSPFVSRKSGAGRQAHVYDLYAVLVHRGSSAQCGHYYAYVKHKGNQWFKVDDSDVRPVGVKEVLSQNAYLLFYACRSPRLAPKQAGSPSSGAAAGGVAPEDAATARKRPREAGSGEEMEPAAKRTCTLAREKMVELFPVQSSEVVVRRAGKGAGGGAGGFLERMLAGALSHILPWKSRQDSNGGGSGGVSFEDRDAEGAGSSAFSVKAGEDFEVVVAIKTPLGIPVTGAHVECMMEEIALLPEGVLIPTGEPSRSTETGTVCFPVRLERSGEFEVAAALRYKGVTHPIGRQTRVKVAPGAMRFASMDAKTSAEVGEAVELVLQMSDADAFGNKIGLPLSERAEADVLAQPVEGVWIHEGKEWPLRLTQPVIKGRGLVVGEVQLLVAGRHAFRVRSCDQEFTASIEISAGVPRYLRLDGDGRSEVLRQWRWCCKMQLLNGQGSLVHAAGQDVWVEMVRTGAGASCGGGVPLKIEVSRSRGRVQGCSLSDGQVEMDVTELQVVLVESETGARKGSYELRAGVVSDGSALTCENGTIHVDLPLDPAAWTSQDLAESLRLNGIAVPGRVVQDEFDAEISGKELIESGQGNILMLLKDCVLRDRKYANRQEKEEQIGQLKKFADSLMEKHMHASLGKGKYKSLLGRCISECNLSIADKPFDKGGNSEIYEGDYEGRAVAIKVPLIKNRSLEVCDDTAAMIESVERELRITKACRHPHVVEVIGLMVGPGRIGIVMERCDTSLAKRIEDAAAQEDWAEKVSLLVDGSSGLSFMHEQKNTTHGDLKPDNLLIQQGRLKVADLELATVRRTITHLTGEVSRKGTTYFMAPEKLLQGAQAAEASKSDIWGFGCVMANVATGRTPFFDDKSEQELLTSLRQRKAVYAREHVLPGCPKKLLELINKCTDYEARERPTMRAVEAELRGILESIQSRDGFGLPALWLEHGCALDSPARLVECAVGSRAYEMIKGRLVQEMGRSTSVLKVEMNVNVGLLRQYDLERRKVANQNGGDANEVLLWHATSREGAEGSILNSGFDVNKCGLDFEYYGAGVYLACDSKLSHRYTAARSATRSMLLVRVACGKMFPRPPLHLSPEYQAFLQQLASQQLSAEDRDKRQREKTRELLRMPSNRCCPEAYHSQVGVDMSGARKSKTEVVVNRNLQAFPAFRVTYRPGAALPDPLSKAGNGALKTLDDYTASDLHREARGMLM